jgi:hypothetical protein
MKKIITRLEERETLKVQEKRQSAENLPPKMDWHGYCIIEKQWIQNSKER